MPTLYLMLGYPGAGKTTAAQAIQRITSAVHLWADAERRQRFVRPTYSHQENLQLYKSLNQQTRQLLAEGKSVIFDTNFNFYKDRQKLRAIAKEQGAATKLVWVTTPKSVAKERAAKVTDGRQLTRILGDIPAAQFERMAANLEPPHSDEPYTAINGRRITDDYIRELLD